MKMPRVSAYSTLSLPNVEERRFGLGATGGLLHVMRYDHDGEFCA